MEKVVWLLSYGPDHVGGRIGDVVVAISSTREALAKEDGGFAVALEPKRGRQVVAASPEWIVSLRGGPAGFERVIRCTKADDLL